MTRKSHYSKNIVLKRVGSFLLPELNLNLCTKIHGIKVSTVLIANMQSEANRSHFNRSIRIAEIACMQPWMG